MPRPTSQPQHPPSGLHHPDLPHIPGQSHLLELSSPFLLGIPLVPSHASDLGLVDPFVKESSLHLAVSTIQGFPNTPISVLQRMPLCLLFSICVLLDSHLSPIGFEHHKSKEFSLYPNIQHSICTKTRVQ